MGKTRQGKIYHYYASQHLYGEALLALALLSDG